MEDLYCFNDFKIILNTILFPFLKLESPSSMKMGLNRVSQMKKRLTCFISN